MAQFMVDTDAVRQKAAQVNGYAEQYNLALVFDEEVYKLIEDTEENSRRSVNVLH